MWWSGELDIDAVPELDRALRHADAPLVVLDLRELEFIDSSGAHLLLAADRRIRRAGRRLVGAIVRSGTLSLYDGADPTGTAHRYSAGEGFTNSPATSISPATKGASRLWSSSRILGLKHGVNPDVPAAKPGKCPF